jgi:hypothetical protein
MTVTLTARGVCVVQHASKPKYHSMLFSLASADAAAKEATAAAAAMAHVSVDQWVPGRTRSARV